MTVKTNTKFDLETYRRAFEAWDKETLLECYSDEVELIEVNHENPPSSPRIRRGKEVLRGIFEGGAAVGVKGTVENGFAEGERAALTFTCEFPDGRKVMANAILELEDGLIARHMEVQSGDPKQ
jgi:ketosteroid isomerase-like protein